MYETPQVELLEKARKGDSAAIYQLYTDTRDYAYFAVKCYIRDEKDILVVLKDAYIIIFGRLEDIAPGSSFKSWLNLVLAVKSLHYLRNKKVKLDVKENFIGLSDDRELFPQAWLQQNQKRQDILRVIDSLPDGQRLAVILHYLGGFQVSEIAQYMGVNEGAANTHLHYGKASLRVGAVDMDEGSDGLPVLTQLFYMEAEAMVMPIGEAKSVYQEIMLFFMNNGKAPKLDNTKVSISKGAGRSEKEQKKESRSENKSTGNGKAYIPWVIMILAVVLILIFCFWNFQRKQGEIGDQLVSQYEQSKAVAETEEQEYQDAVSAAGI